MSIRFQITPLPPPPKFASREELERRYEAFLATMEIFPEPSSAAYEFISPSVQLPPVDCPILILVPFGTKVVYGDGVEILCLENKYLQVTRKSHLHNKDGEMEYWTDCGGLVTGRLPWTYR